MLKGAAVLEKAVVLQWGGSESPVAFIKDGVAIGKHRQFAPQKTYSYLQSNIAMPGEVVRITGPGYYAFKHSSADSLVSLTQGDFVKLPDANGAVHEGIVMTCTVRDRFKAVSVLRRRLVYEALDSRRKQDGTPLRRLKALTVMEFNTGIEWRYIPEGSVTVTGHVEVAYSISMPDDLVNMLHSSCQLTLTAYLDANTDYVVLLMCV